MQMSSGSILEPLLGGAALLLRARITTGAGPQDFILCTSLLRNTLHERLVLFIHEKGRILHDLGTKTPENRCNFYVNRMKQIRGDHQECVRITIFKILI